MSLAWQTVEQAAVTLGISTRTIARRIAKGDLQSRLNAGRREVYIDVPEARSEPVIAETIDADFTESVKQPDPSYEETIRHTVSAASTFGADVETSTALILAEDRARRAEMAIAVIQQSTAVVRDEVFRARAGARRAWATVGVMAACVMVAIGWATMTISKSRVETQNLREKTASAVDAGNRQQSEFKTERDNLEAQLATARQSAARVEGQLQEVRVQADLSKAQLAAAKERESTTKPSGLTARIANAVFGD